MESLKSLPGMLYTIYKKGPRWNKDFDYKFDYILFDMASIIWGAILICKIVDVIHITDVNKLSECKIILVVSMSGLTLSWWLFFMDLINIIGY